MAIAQKPVPTETEARDDIGLISRIPRSRIRPFKDQPRHYFDEKEMADLAASIEEIGQQTPIVVKPVSGDLKHDYELVDGERRLIACSQVGVETMLAWVKPVPNADEQFVGSVVANFGRVGHTPLEVAQAIDRIRKSERMKGLPAGEQIRRIARIFARAEPWVYQHLAILRLHPDVQAMMSPELPDNQRLGHLLGVFVSTLHHDLQVEIAREVVARKMNVNQARAYARRRAEEAGVRIGLGRPRHSHDDYKNLVRFVNRTTEGANTFLLPSVQAMIQKRSSLELDEVARELEVCIGALAKLRQAFLRRPVKPI